MQSKANCTTCGFPLDSDSHLYNVHCVASNAEYDQLLAEVQEAQNEPMDESLAARLLDIGRERVAEVLAFQRFKNLFR